MFACLRLQLLDYWYKMSILNYFNKTGPGLPESSARLSFSAFTSANHLADQEIAAQTSHKSGTYHYYPDAMRLRIGRYAMVNSVSAAVRHFQIKLGHPINESTVHTFCKRLDDLLKSGKASMDVPLEDQDLPPSKKRGRPTALVDDIEASLIEYLKNLHVSAGLPFVTL